MSSSNTEIVAGIPLSLDEPTNLSLKRMQGWVVWQFPRPYKKGYQGAVRSSEPGKLWLPALIRADKDRVKVFANIGTAYGSPEEAAAYFQERGG